MEGRGTSEVLRDGAGLRWEDLGIGAEMGLHYDLTFWRKVKGLGHVMLPVGVGRTDV